jgi:hypothetical protein
MKHLLQARFREPPMVGHCLRLIERTPASSR